MAARTWADACRVLTTALATDEEVSQALRLCLDLHAAHVPCESSLQVRLSPALRHITKYHSNAWMRDHAGQVLVALGQIRGAMARAAQIQDARVLDDDDSRAISVSFAMPVEPAASAGNATAQPAASAGNAASLPDSVHRDTKLVSTPLHRQEQSGPAATNRMVLEPSLRSMVLEPTLRPGPRGLWVWLRWDQENVRGPGTGNLAKMFAGGSAVGGAWLRGPRASPGMARAT